MTQLDYESYAEKKRRGRIADKAVIQTLESEGYEVKKKSQTKYYNTDESVKYCLFFIGVVMLLAVLLISVGALLERPQALFQTTTNHVTNVQPVEIKERIVTSGERNCVSIKDTSSGKYFLECEK